MALVDQFLRSDPLFAGAWHRRLALRAAATLIGLREDEAALRVSFGAAR